MVPPTPLRATQTRRQRLPRWVALIAAAIAVITILVAPPAATRQTEDRTVAELAGHPLTAVRIVGQTATTTLTIQQTFSLEELPLGSRTVDTIRIANTGTAVASGVRVRVDLPTGLPHFSSTPAGTLDGATVNWNLGTLAAGTSTDIELTLRATRSGSLSIRASVRSDATDEVVSNDILQVTGTGLSPGVAQTPASPTAPQSELAQTGATTTWLFVAAFALLAVGVWALEAASRLPAMGGFWAPRRRRLNRPVFHPVRSSRAD